MKKNYALLTIVFWFVALYMAFAQQPIRLHKFPNLSSDTWFYRDTPGGMWQDVFLVFHLFS